MDKTSIKNGKQSLRVWLRLLACENMIERQLRQQLRQEFGITLPQFEVLAELEYVGEPMSMTALSRRLMVSNGNVTGVVDRLEREGLVKRTSKDTDRRVQLIRLTATGLGTFREMAVRHERWVASAFSDLPASELGQLFFLLTKTHDFLKRNRLEKSE